MDSRRTGAAPTYWAASTANSIIFLLNSIISFEQLFCGDEPVFGNKNATYHISEPAPPGLIAKAG
jgi:hypothetical protein